MQIKVDLVVTRHQGLIDFLKDKGIITDDAEIISHVSDPEIIRDKVVLGNLPMHLAALTKAVIVPVLQLTPDMRGKELSKEDVEAVFKGLHVFKVEKLGEL